MSYPSHSSITTEQRLSLPLNGVIYTTVRPVSTEKPLPAIGATMDSELGPAFAASRIISVQKSPAKGEQGKQLVIRHAIIPSEADQLSSNWEFSTCDMGGTRFPSVTRTVVLLASAVAHDTPAKGSAMPHVTDDLFTSKGYILVDRQVMRSGMELEPTFRVERRNYMVKSAIKNLGVDSLNGRMLTSTTTLYYSTEIVTGATTAAELFADSANAYWGLQATGVQRSGQQLSCEWYAITEETVVSGTFAAGAVTVRSFNTVESYYWPPVLSGVGQSTWTRRDGGIQNYLYPIYSKEGYRGECKAVVTETFHVAAPTIADPDVMLPMPISIQSPNFSISIGPTLHAALGPLAVTNGNADPEFEWFIDTFSYAATEPATWPSTITIENVQPFRGGYLKTSVVIDQPS